MESSHNTASTRTENPPNTTPSTSQESDIAAGTTSCSSRSTTSRPDDGTNYNNKGSGLERQCPPMKQVMEHPVDQLEGGDDHAKYRIPSHVFSRANTGNQMAWSTNSNESLFSIQMGNMSFTKDHLSWMSNKSEFLELDPSNITSTRPSMEAPAMMSNHQYNSAPATDQSADDHVDKINNINGDRTTGDTAAAAAETPPPKLHEHADKKPDHHQNLAEPTGATSFAFPKLAGQVDKNASVSGWPKAMKQQQEMHAKNSHQPSTDPPPSPSKQSNVIQKLGSGGKKQTSGDHSPNHKAAPSTTDHHHAERWTIISCFSCWPFRN